MGTIDDSCVIGVDLGGTKLLAGAIAADLAIHSRVRRVIRGLSRNELIDEVVAAIEEARVQLEQEPLAVGIGVPATIDPRTGRTFKSTHLPLADMSVVDVLTERTGLPVFADNDATCAAIAEHRHGAAFGARDAVVVTIGTGIGAGIIASDAVLRGSHGAAGELGHIPLEADGLPCGKGCPSRGCFETRVSGPALEREAERVAIARPDSELGKAAAQGPLSGPRIVELAHDGDFAALDVMSIVGKWLGVGLVAIANLFDPEVIVIGGGLAAAGDLLLEPAREVLAERGMEPGCGATVTTAKFGADSGMLGAAVIARDGLAT